MHNVLLYSPYYNTIVEHEYLSDNYRMNSGIKHE